ncbi:Protein RTM1-like protein 3 [Colletotrichum chlorophyti]|uniref:Protein RTM1-like protein 3 n=1 Tax=Colletotrichum chlorophyti TaxID=708187 RepID=A0A1Q8S1S8_9PEZI|nr:Protein RTM1-like protein 3 [Colletotrichum chlorophyti]
MTPVAVRGVLRARSGQESPDRTLVPYIIQALFMLIAPALYAATIHVEPACIFTLVDAWMTKGIASRISFLMAQSAGGGLQATGGAIDVGARNITVGGLFIQLILFGVLIAVAAAFCLKLYRYPTPSAYKVVWKQHKMALFVASLLVMVRSVSKLAEYLQGFDGYLLRHEA